MACRGVKCVSKSLTSEKLAALKLYQAVSKEEPDLVDLSTEIPKSKPASRKREVKASSKESE